MASAPELFVCDPAAFNRCDLLHGFVRVCLVWLPPPRPSVRGFRCDSTDSAANYGEGNISLRLYHPSAALPVLNVLVGT